MMINILAIYGSPRRKQNSDTLLEKFLEGIHDEDCNINRLYASKQHIKPCIACDGCYKDGKCVLKDDMQDIYRSIDDADIIIVASPIYFYTVTAQLKALIDRCQAVWSSKYIAKTEIISKKKRLGFFICTGGASEEYYHPHCLLDVMDIFFKCINTEFCGHLAVLDVDNVHIENRTDILTKAFDEGKRIKSLI